MVMQEFVRQHVYFFHTLSALVAGSVSSVSLGFACIPLYQSLLGFALADAVYMTSMTFFLIFMFVFISSFSKKTIKAIWILNSILSSSALVVYLVTK